MKSATRQPRILLSQSALAHNLQRVKQLTPQSLVVSMVKANAYGHGVAFALQALQQTDLFGVACIQEARQLRTLGCQHPIALIEGVFNLEEWFEASAQGFECVIHHKEQIDWALANPDVYQQKKLKLWLKVNTGMNRLGLIPDDARVAAQQLRKAGFELVLTMHFANADEPSHPLNQQQVDTFLQLKQQLDPIQASCCNSAAIFNWPQLHFDYVRPGIMLYGSSPFDDQTAQALNLKPVMQFESNLIAIHQIDAGQSVGYGSRFITTRPTCLGIVAAGYGDGYPRVVNEKTYVSINHQAAPIIGRVSMDMLAVDLTDLSADIQINSPVILWGDNPSVDFIAQQNNTIGYELLCRLTNRPQRIVIE